MKYEAQDSALYNHYVRPSFTPVKKQRQEFVQNPLVRILDVSISVVAVIFLLPIFLLIGILIKLQDGGPALFGHSRVGLHGQEFKCLKFRSMHVKSDELLRNLLATSPEASAEWQKDHKLRNDPRITKLGRLLRKTSFDEFPQLLNVIAGDMSLVGPRPIIRAEIVKYGTSYGQYSSVLPGITGLWQVMGRNDVSYRRRVAMDRLFAHKMSLKLYLLILVKTLPAVLFQRGSY